MWIPAKAGMTSKAFCHSCYLSISVIRDFAIALSIERLPLRHICVFGDHDLLHLVAAFDDFHHLGVA